MDWVAVISGFGVGAIIGITGVGGGSLMTPLLLSVFKLNPALAIGTDLWFAAVTKTVASGIYGVEQRINVIHRQGQDVRIYVNGSLKHKLTDDEDVSNYNKYGCYGTLRTGSATVKWRQARFFKDGQPPA